MAGVGEYLMRVFVVEPRSSGGMIHYAYQLCAAMAAEGADVVLVTAADYELAALLHNFHVENRMRLWALNVPKPAPAANPLLRLARKGLRLAQRGVRALRLIREWNRLVRYLLRERPDVIQFGKIEFAFESIFLKRLARRGLRLAQITHEFERREQEGLLAALENRLYQSVFSSFSALFFHEENNRDRFLSLFTVDRARTHIIPHGNEEIFHLFAAQTVRPPDLLNRFGLAPDEPVVLFFGGLMPSKGLPELLEAFAEVRGASRARLVIAGYPSKFMDMAALHAQVESLGLSDAVIFDTRYVPLEEVGPLMELARLVVYPYRSSTASGSLQVAYAFGRAVVATRVGGLPDVVEEGRSGLLVPPQDPAALAAAILALVSDPARAAEMGAHARHLSQTKYAWPPIARRILEVYSALS
jgi:glycosyltransferase involved in cell wall biosynthesis